MNTPLITTAAGRVVLAILEIVLVASIVLISSRTALLRDGDPNVSEFGKRPFSMAKTQLAFWTAVVIGCFIYVYFARGVFEGMLNSTALYLLGISAGTTALSSVAAGPLPEKGAAPIQPHTNFLNDLLSDNDGMNIHRLQMLLWTVVFGAIFISEAVRTGEFPKFDDQAYWLMGISSVTYVWFKRAEK